MIQQLRSAGEQIRAACDNYIRTCATLEEQLTSMSPPHRFPSELFRQLDTELDFISAYESRIQQIKLSVSQVQARCSRLAPINSLPPEILSHVFRLASPRFCNLHTIHNEGYFPKHPDYIAQVCRAWRSTAISTSSLWSHIDLSSHRLFCHKLVLWAEMYMSRSGNLPLELHIADSQEDDNTTDYSGLYWILSRISSRVETLVFVAATKFRRFHDLVLKEFLRNPPLATTNFKIVLRSETSHYNAFVRSHLENPSIGILDGGSGNLQLVFTKDKLESCFANLTLLHLRGIFLAWSSRAYHGLVDLRLTSSATRWSHIKEAELKTILESSPALRILYFGLEIREATLDSAHIAPVNLPELEVVNISALCEEGPRLQAGTFLRLLAPGTKPLRLTVNNQYGQTGSVAEVESFFARSKVEMFYTKFISPPIGSLVRLAPNLVRIVFDSISPGNFLHQTLLDSRSPQENGLAPPYSLRSLNVHNSFLFEEELRLLLKYCPVDIVLHNCPIISSHLMEDEENTQLTKEELSQRFPTASIADYNLYKGEDPTPHWNAFD